MLPRLDARRAHQRAQPRRQLVLAVAQPRAVRVQQRGCGVERLKVSGFARLQRGH